MITPSDFFVDGESDEVQTLVDSIAVQAGQEKLRQIAQRNLLAVRDCTANVPNARELVSTIWMRSMSPAKAAGGTPAQLHLDITRGQVVDDNAFQAEITILVENSVNIHGDEVPGGPLWFGVNENPRSKVRACARNHKLWQSGAAATASQTVYPGKDIDHIRKTLRHIFVPETPQPPARVIVLGPNWKSDPWNEIDEADKPSKWDRPVLLVIPEQIEGGQAGLNACLGGWLAKHVPKRRNTVRFLLPAGNTGGIYTDSELTYSARCSFLCSTEGWGSDPTYRSLRQDFDRPLRLALKTRFNRFALLRKWDFQQPQNCSFETGKISGQESEITAAVETKIVSDLFDQTEFKTFVLKCAKDSDSVGSLLDDLTEPPPPNTGEAIPFLGETKIYELVLDIVAQGDVFLNVNGIWIGRRPEDASEDDAKLYVKSKAFRTNQEMRQILLGLPGAVGGGTVTAPATPSSGPTSIAQPPETPVDGVLPPYPPNGVGGNESTTTGGAGIEEGSSGGGTATPPTSVPIMRNRSSEAPTTGINLSGCFESWGIPSAKILDTAKIEFSGLTVQQVKLILQRIPSTSRR